MYLDLQLSVDRFATYITPIFYISSRFLFHSPYYNPSIYSMCGAVLPRLPVQDFITHCWREPFHEFMDSLRHAYDVAIVKPHLFICAFSLFQGLSDLIT